MKAPIFLGVYLLAVAIQAQFAELKPYPTRTTRTTRTTRSTRGSSTTPTCSISNPISFSLSLPSSSTTSSAPSQTPSRGPLPSTGEYRIGVVVYPGFTVLDVFGPLEALNQLSLQYYLNLTIIGETLDAVSSKSNSGWFNPAVKSTHDEAIVPTHTFQDDLEWDLLIVPGGVGTRAPYPYLNSTVDYIKKAYPKTKYLLSVCTGALLNARAGILDGKRATTNKKAWNFVVPNGPKVKWVALARWTVDGNIWSSSGVSAGTDATLAWIAHIYGNATAQNVVNGMEWTGDWQDNENDKSAHLYNLGPANNTNGG